MSIQTPSISSRTARVIFFIGGTGRDAALRWSHLLNAQAVIYCDVVKELDATAYGIRQFPVSSGALRELLDRTDVDDRFNKAYRRASIGDSGEGASQNPIIGHCLIQDLINNGELAHFLEELASGLLVSENAEFDSVEVWIVASGGGGTGAGIATEMATAFETVAIKSLCCMTVTTNIVRYGPITHVGIGTSGRIDINNAATVTNDILWYLNQETVSKSCRRLWLLETPVMGEDAASRNHYVTATLVALLGREASDLGIRLTNWGSVKIAGGITLVRTRHLSEIRPIDLITDVAGQWKSKLVKLISDPTASNLVTNVDIEWRSDTTASEVVELAMREASGAAERPARYDRRKMIAPSYAISLTTTIKSLTGVTDHIRLFDMLNSPVRSAAEFRDRMDVLYGVAEEIHGLEEAYRTRRDAAQTKQQLAEAAVKKTENSLWSHDLGPTFIRMFVARPKLESALRAALMMATEADIEAKACSAALDQLGIWTSQIATIKNETTRPLKQVIRLANEGIARTGDGAVLTEVDDALDAFLTDLADNPTARTLDTLSRSLQQAIKSLTPAGLGAVLGARNGEVSHLATALMSPSGWVESPWYAKGAGPQSHGYTIIAIPKTTSAQAAILAREISERRGGPQVHTIAGVYPAAVELTLRPASRIEDIFPPRLRTQLETIGANPHRWLTKAATKQLDYDRFEFGMNVDELFRDLMDNDAKTNAA